MSESTLVVLTAVVTAPILEELFFRGLLQPWFSRRREAGLAGMGIALVLAFLQRADKTATAWKTSGLVEAVQELWAPAFVLAMIPGFFLVRRLGAELAAWRRRHPSLSVFRRGSWTDAWSGWPDQTTEGVTASPRPLARAATLAPMEWPRFAREAFAARAAGGIYAGALLFAAVHSFAWPSPVSLFVLGLGLGYLRYRTQSLVASIVVHALFNGVSCTLLLIQPMLAPKEEKGKETTSAVRLDAASPTSTMVPGSWLPRRMYASPIAPSRGDATDEVTWPTSLPSRKSLVPGSASPPDARRTPRRVRFAWPRSRAMTMGSCPRKQPFV